MKESVLVVSDIFSFSFVQMFYFLSTYYKTEKLHNHGYYKMLMIYLIHSVVHSLYLVDWRFIQSKTVRQKKNIIFLLTANEIEMQKDEKKPQVYRWNKIEIHRDKIEFLWCCLTSFFLSFCLFSFLSFSCSILMLFSNNEKPITQVPPEFLRPQQETAVHIGEFTLFYRTLPLRLKIEKQPFQNAKSFILKCEATFGRYTHLTRAKSARVFIVSTDDLTNQKLVNSKNVATATGNQIALLFSIWKK